MSNASIFIVIIAIAVGPSNARPQRSSRRVSLPPFKSNRKLKLSSVLRQTLLHLHQALQVLDVPDGGPQRLHLAEALVGALTRQVVPEFGVALVHAPHPLPLALVALLDEGRLEGTLVHAEVAAVVEGGQVGQQPGAPQRVHARRVEEEGHGAILPVAGGGRHAEAQVRRRREGGAHGGTC